jgi:hypothetical protein
MYSFDYLNSLTFRKKSDFMFRYLLFSKHGDSLNSQRSICLGVFIFAPTLCGSSFVRRPHSVFARNNFLNTGKNSFKHFSNVMQTISLLILVPFKSSLFCIIINLWCMFHGNTFILFKYRIALVC